MKLNSSTFVCCGVALSAALAFLSCGGGKRSVADSAADSPMVAAEAYHADNDIAMTVRSIADAIHVGESLDSLSYNFEGVLTDGTGRPLYTALNGLPGEWSVKVISDSLAVVENVDAGDLYPSDLESYILSALQMDASYMVAEQSKENGGYSRIYEYPGGIINIDVRNKKVEAIEGSIMKITLRSNTASR